MPTEVEQDVAWIQKVTQTLTVTRTLIVTIEAVTLTLMKLKGSIRREIANAEVRHAGNGLGSWGLGLGLGRVAVDQG